MTRVNAKSRSAFLSIECLYQQGLNIYAFKSPNSNRKYPFHRHYLQFDKHLSWEGLDLVSTATVQFRVFTNARIHCGRIRVWAIYGSVGYHLTHSLPIIVSLRLLQFLSSSCGKYDLLISGSDPAVCALCFTMFFNTITLIV